MTGSLGRRLGAVAALATAAFGSLALLGAPAASAHPLGNFTVNRYSGLELSPGQVRVTYVLDMAEIPTFQTMPGIDTDADGTASEAERQAWADREAPQVLRKITMTVDGRPEPLSLVSDSMRFRPGQAGLPILYFTAVFRGKLSGGGSIHYRDANFADRIGWKEVTARSDPGVAVFGSTVKEASVSHELLAYPVDLLSNPLDTSQAALSFRPGAGSARLASGASGPTASGAPIASGGRFAALVGWRLTPLVLAVSLALAFGFGTLHALGPGHGKTITAAYLVGAGARRRQAVLIGVAVSLMHTGSVLALGLVFLVLARSFPPERVYPWLELATGLVALSLGGGLLLVRLRARKRGLDPWHPHRHPWDQAEGGHDHGHDGHHDHEESHTHDHGLPAEAAAPVSAPKLVALAVAGGILPSPTAFIVLLGAVRAHRIGYGLGLILAFSAGLAAALVLVGLFAIRARAAVSRRFKGQWMTLLPIASAAVIVGFGLFFAVRGSTRIL